MKKMVFGLGMALLVSLAMVGTGAAQESGDLVVSPPNLAVSNYVHRTTGACNGTIIYNTTHASNQGAELTPAATGSATNLGDLIVIAGTDRFVCEIQIEVFTLNDTSPFNLTMTLWTDCTTSGASNSPCGNGPGTLFPNSTVSVNGIVPPANGVIFGVVFAYPFVDLSGEVDNTIAVSLNASRGNVFWRINETPVVGAIPAGEPATSFVERCGSTGTNNGCSRNFGVNNNFAISIEAATTPVELQSFTIE